MNQWKIGEKVSAFGCVGWVAEITDTTVACDFEVDGHTWRGVFSIDGKVYPWAKEVTLIRAIIQ
jgi:hypothetical protein